jgi:hypothetical protein
VAKHSQLKAIWTRAHLRRISTPDFLPKIFYEFIQLKLFIYFKNYSYLPHLQKIRKSYRGESQVPRTSSRRSSFPGRKRETSRRGSDSGGILAAESRGRCSPGTASTSDTCRARYPTPSWIQHRNNFSSSLTLRHTKQDFSAL